MLGRLGTRIAVIEPSPMGLLRAAASRATGPARLAAVPAVLPRPEASHRHGGRRASAAVLARLRPRTRRGGRHRSWPPIRRSGCWGGTAGSACRSTRVFIHGRPDLKLTIDPESFRQRTGARLVRCAGPDHEPASAALGVALNNPLTEAAGHDLARGFKPAVPIRESSPGPSWSSRRR